MSNIGYREIMDTSSLSIKQLNDTLRALWSKVMGNIGERDLDERMLLEIKGKLDQQTFETVLAQTEQAISLCAARQDMDALSEQIRQQQAALSVQATQIAQKVGTEDFNEFAQTVLTRDSFDVSIDGERQLHISEDGVDASSVTAPNVSAVYTGPTDIAVNPDFTDDYIERQAGAAVRSLQEALDRINDRRLSHPVRIEMENVNHYERVVLRGIIGSGSLEILGNGASFYGGISIAQCGIPIELRGADMSIYPGENPGLKVEASAFVRLDGARIIGSGESGAAFCDGAKGVLRHCEFSGFTNAVSADFMATAHVQHCTGSGTLCAAHGGVISASGTMPSGGASAVDNGQVWVGGASQATGTQAAAPDAVTSTQYLAVSTATCRNTGTWLAKNLRQNFYETLGPCKGCIWFDNGTLRAELSGKTIRSATLRLSRVAGSGKASAVNVVVRGLTAAGSGVILSNNTDAAVYGGLSAMLGGISGGETVAFALPVSFVQALADGSINGLALYGGETSASGTRDYSSNYCRFWGVDEGGEAPVLTVNYL